MYRETLKKTQLTRGSIGGFEKATKLKQKRETASGEIFLNFSLSIPHENS